MYCLFFVIRHTGVRHCYGDPVPDIHSALATVARLNDNQCKPFDYGFAVAGFLN